LTPKGAVLPKGRKNFKGKLFEAAHKKANFEILAFCQENREALVF
jgi:hypothetical protein